MQNGYIEIPNPSHYLARSSMNVVQASRPAITCEWRDSGRSRFHTRGAACARWWFRQVSGYLLCAVQKRSFNTMKTSDTFTVAADPVISELWRAKTAVAEKIRFRCHGDGSSVATDRRSGKCEQGGRLKVGWTAFGSAGTAPRRGVRDSGRSASSFRR
jgi:hypothetical protein